MFGFSAQICTFGNPSLVISRSGQWDHLCSVTEKREMSSSGSFWSRHTYEFWNTGYLGTVNDFPFQSIQMFLRNFSLWRTGQSTDLNCHPLSNSIKYDFFFPVVRVLSKNKLLEILLLPLPSPLFVLIRFSHFACASLPCLLITPSASPPRLLLYDNALSPHGLQIGLSICHAW